MVHYYDLVLGLIPLALFGTTAALVAAGFGLTVAAPVGGILSASLVGHALFVKGPVDATGRTGSDVTEDSRTDAGSSAASPLETAD
ncbi:hypothetical protein BRC81_03775 [Halobacteriales archaeon QS_1_68_20]|nr:MAG: hypothetical protein BRC81_03775 [Halobacteriales archaeon QS_1_68_20]